MVLSIGELRRAGLFMQSGSEKKAVVFYCALAALQRSAFSIRRSVVPDHCAVSAVFCLLSSIFGLLFFAGYAQGDIVTIGLSGYVSNVIGEQGLLPEAISFNESITGSYTYGTTAFDINPSPWEGDYQFGGAPFGITLNIGGMLFASKPQDADFLIETSNDYNGKDSYIISSNNNFSLSNGTLVTPIRWLLEDNTASALSDDSLISPDSVWWYWQNRLLTITCRGAGGVVRIEADITEAEVTQVIPEPTTVLLFMAGLPIFCRREKRRTSNIQH
jgi:hypothetical protein